ncbi:CopG family transcriptional regulator [Desulfovibrio ferrophilus]|uniref:Ribbon-helix-helix protein CopG domain-containing protein n=1 Tax=Desulfovibrio ferrophilus TaxID=241368 RepID=A0A2Z6B3P6_9BACT|nr:CopG family transcriptional regulator [Desulfovibrio ferrophilus]BBD10144.1 uncharacterized protein DFE_A0043 [Desulfovibrio ferrophilus]
MGKDLKHTTVRLSEDERAGLDKRRKREGGTRSAHIRLAVHRYLNTEPPELSPKVLERLNLLEQALAPLGSNLNQIARRLNQFKADGLNVGDLEDVQGDLLDLFTDMRDEMIEVQDELTEQLRLR